MPEHESPTRFLKLDDETVTRLIDAKLTAAQYRTFLYFALVDPFGNRPVETNGKMARDRLEISKSTYYDALARLQEEQLFDFEDVILRVRNKVGIRAPERHGEKTPRPPSDAINSDDTIVREIGTGSEDLNSSPKNQTSVRKFGLESEKLEMRSPDPLPDKASRSPHNLSLDLNTSSDQTERERKLDQDSEPEKEDRGEVISSILGGVVNPSLPIDKKAIAPVWTHFSAPGLDPGFFEFVLAKVKQLPTPPADNACVAEGWIQKQGHLLYAQYQAWQDERQRVEQLRQTLPVVATVPPPPSSDPPAITAEGRLTKYQAMWNSTVLRSNAERAIASHPEWGIAIGPDGPCLLETAPSVQPEKMREDTAAESPPCAANSMPVVAQMLPTLETVLSDIPDSGVPSSQDINSPPSQELWDGPSYAVG